MWVLGFYERGTKNIRAIYVKDRSQETLTQVILENVEQGAEIFTDFWRGYNLLSNFYNHRVINKVKKGSGTTEFETTNRVESMWSNIKRYLFLYSSFHGPHLQMYLDEAVWRIKNKQFSQRVEFLAQLNSFVGESKQSVLPINVIRAQENQEIKLEKYWESVWD